MERLLQFFPNFFNEEEKSSYGVEIRRIQNDSSLPTFKPEIRLDDWWSEGVFKSGKYPTLSKMVRICLSIFTAPIVEQSFSLMNNTITSTTNRLDTETFEAIQSVRYYLKSNIPDDKMPKGKRKKSKSLILFNRDNILTDPVDTHICKNIQKAHYKYEKKMNEKRKKKSVIEIHPSVMHGVHFHGS